MNREKLHIALAHLEVVNNLPADLFKTILFTRVLRLAKITDRVFFPAGRNDVSGPLPKIIYHQVQERYKTSLLSEASGFGLEYLGGDITV